MSTPGVISRGINNFMIDDAKIRQQNGGIKSGKLAVRNKTGIHAFSEEEKHQVSIKGKNAFLEKMKDPVYAAEHARKIKEGHARRKVKKYVETKRKDSFGFF